MISIKAPGGYEKLEYTALPECGFTEGANMKMEGEVEFALDKKSSCTYF